MAKPIPIGVSARHLHVSREDLETLFGPGAELTVYKEVGQPGQYAANEKVTLVGPKRQMENVRILGPVRKSSQIEISITDSVALGITAPVLYSGNLAGSGTLTVIGPKGTVEMKEKVIVAGRHMHASPADAEELGLKDGDLISVRCGDIRSVIFEKVLVRVHPEFALELHIDTDEANAAGVRGGTCEIVR
ncbi:MAG: phosphate propanoyltransferase [Chloroflexota bacterium]